MPKNNKVKVREFPVKLKFGKRFDNRFKNLSKNIKVTLVQFPKYEEIRDLVVSFALSTYQDFPNEFNELLSDKEKDLVFFKVLKRELLPATLETLRLNFCIEGITIQEVTHILRYTNAKFSAECSGEKWWSDKAFCVPQSIENSPEFYERYKTICKQAAELYADMVDSKEISLRDARYILPRATETFYFMSMSLGEALKFIDDRTDRQIQPIADNLMAYQMMNELMKAYPIIAKLFGKGYLSRPAKFYVNSASKTFGSNLYPPDKNNDLFEYNEKSFIYDKTRDQFNGTDKTLSKLNNEFEKQVRKTEKILRDLNDQIDQKYGKDFFLSDIELRGRK